MADYQATGVAGAAARSYESPMERAEREARIELAQKEQEMAEKKIEYLKAEQDRLNALHRINTSSAGFDEQGRFVGDPEWAQRPSEGALPEYPSAMTPVEGASVISPQDTQLTEGAIPAQGQGGFAPPGSVGVPRSATEMALQKSPSSVSLGQRSVPPPKEGLIGIPTAQQNAQNVLRNTRLIENAFRAQLANGKVSPELLNVMKSQTVEGKIATAAEIMKVVSEMATPEKAVDTAKPILMEIFSGLPGAEKIIENLHSVSPEGFTSLLNTGDKYKDIDENGKEVVRTVSEGEKVLATYKIAYGANGTKTFTLTGYKPAKSYESEDIKNRAVALKYKSQAAMARQAKQAPLDKTRPLGQGFFTTRTKPFRR